MNNIIGHIVGLDEIHKHKLMKQLPNDIRVIDLDAYQQSIYNDKEIVKQKMLWTHISKNILMYRKQKKLIGSKRIKTKNLNKQIKQLLAKRNTIRQNIHRIWKTKMTNMVNKELAKNKKYHILFIGFNIFPKDYRLKINIPMRHLFLNFGNTKNSNPINSNQINSNKIIFDTGPNKYAANQIKYYLNKYSDKIINGTFPLNLLKTDYLSNKYEKFTNFYHKQEYNLVDNDNLLNIVKEFNKQLTHQDKMVGKNIFVATLFKSGDTIPVNSRTPIEGFYSKEEAIAAMKPKLKYPSPLYLYQVKADQFHFINGKLIATHELNPINEESFLLTI